MSKKELIEKTLAVLQKLPTNKIAAIADFADFILQRNKDMQITEGIVSLSIQSKSYEFLNEEEDLYTLNDVKAPYNGKR